VSRAWRALARLRLAGPGLALLLCLQPTSAAAKPVQVPKPGGAATCPVCGMRVAKHPRWAATVLFRDGHVAHFDGAKHMFQVLLDLPKWAPGRRDVEIAAVRVTEHAGSTRIDARRAWFVVDSDLLGPMGQELVPLASAAAAATFMRIHGGRVLRFGDVDSGLIERLRAPARRQPESGGGAVHPAPPPDPGPRDTCPVCGMFVAKYPPWVATVVFADGQAEHFDGAKDMFKYLLDLPKWAPGRRQEEIASIHVTEYYGLARTSARQAWYVIGSDVLGPMGHELVPLASEAEAGDFMRDHKGRRVLRFDEVELALLERLDAGRFH
jgi:nitrous oxide reductase accessory protein NosL